MPHDVRRLHVGVASTVCCVGGLRHVASERAECSSALCSPDTFTCVCASVRFLDLTAAVTAAAPTAAAAHAVTGSAWGDVSHAGLPQGMSCLTPTGPPAPCLPQTRNLPSNSNGSSAACCMHRSCTAAVVCSLCVDTSPQESGNPEAARPCWQHQLTLQHADLILQCVSVAACS
jgi:hypothetical protein